MPGNSEKFFEIKQTLRHRLKHQMVHKGLSISDVAQVSGIGRSLLSTYLSDNQSLPNLLNLMRLSEALDCEPSYLLASTCAKNACAIDGSFVLTAETGAAMSRNDKLVDLLDDLGKTPGQFLYYHPSTLPELLKTEAVVAVERKTSPTQSVINFRTSMNSVFDFNLVGGVLIDERTLSDLMLQKNAYATLSEKDAREQMAVMEEFSKSQFPNLQFKVINAVAQKISPSLLIGRELLLQEFFSYTFRIQSARIISSVLDDFNASFRIGIDFTTWLHDQRVTQGKSSPVHSGG